MRVALAGIMTATVITSSVPVNAAEPVAAKQEETTKDGEAGASADITVKFVDERGNVVFEKKLTFEEGVYNYSVLEEYIQKFIPDYKLETSGDFNAVQGAVIEARVMQKAPEEKTQTVKLNYYDEAAKKQIKEAELEVSISDSAVDMATVARYMPEGYVLNGSDCAIRDGYVYASVSPEEETRTVYINYYDESAKKQVAEVPVKISADRSEVEMATLLRYLPEGYDLVDTDLKVRDKFVYASVKEREEETKATTFRVVYRDQATQEVVDSETLTGGRQNDNGDYVFKADVDFNIPEGYQLAVAYPEFVVAAGGSASAEILVNKLEETQTVKINYYDETEEKQVAEVPVQISSDRSELEKATVVRFLPAGYVLKNTDLKIRDGYVYVAVEKETEAPVDPENPEIPLTPLEPSTPVEKPEKPETPNKDDNQKEESNKKEESKKDDKKKAPKTSDEANPMAAALPAGVSLAAILALLVKKFK